MKRADFLLLVAVLVLTLSVRAWASPADLLRDDGVVVDHQPTRVGGGAADTLFINRYHQESWQQEADNVVLAEPATIARIGWWGFYGTFDQTHEPPAGPETFRIRLYEARTSDGLPGAMIFEQTVDSADRTPTSQLVYAEVMAPEYFYQVDLAQGVMLEAGVAYWLEVVQVGDIASAFRWEGSSADLDGVAYLNGIVLDWRSTFPQVAADAAFQLSTVPESASISLFVPSLLVVRTWGRRRQGRG